MRIPSSGVVALASLLLTTSGCEPTEGRDTELSPAIVRDGGGTAPDAGSVNPDGGDVNPDAGVPRVAYPRVPACTDHFDETGRFCKYLTSFTQRQRVVIRDTQAWKSLWQQLWSQGAHQPALPAVDFERELVVVAMMGTRGSTGYDIVVREVVARDGGLDVTVQEIEPDRSGAYGVCGGLAVMTAPVAAMRVPRAEGEVRFIETHLAYNDCGL